MKTHQRRSSDTMTAENGSRPSRAHPATRAMLAAWLGLASVLLLGLGDNAARSLYLRRAEPVSVRLDATVEVLPARAAEVELWIPVPGGDESQDVDLSTLDVHVDGHPLHWELTTDRHGNHYVYLRGAAPAKPFSVRYSVPVRRHSSGFRGSEPLSHVIESTIGPDGTAIDYPYDAKLEEAMVSIEQADSVEQLVGTVLDRLLGAVGGAGDDLQQAVLLNEILRRNGEYIKTGAYGEGDSTWFCLTGPGNCTDFHFTYLDVAKRVALPALFRIGIPLSPDPDGPTPRYGEVPGYHCWVYLDGILGFGIDPSWEARLSAPTGTYFGQPLNDRIKLTEGTDLVLSPPIQGEPLPFLFEAYAEADGVALERIYGAAAAAPAVGPYVRTTYTFERID